MRFVAVILAIASISIVFRADALAIGEIEVRTMLSEPLDARVPLVAVTPSELASLVVSPASVAAYETAGVELTGYVADLDFEVVRGASPPFVRIRGQRPAREPFLDLLLEFNWGSGRLLRNYTILLDPPAVAFEPVAQAQTATSDAPPERELVPDVPSRATARIDQRDSVASSPQAGTTDPAFNEGVGWVDSSKPGSVAAVTASPEPRRTAASSPSAAPRVREYGPVKPKETLWSIAFRLRPDPALTMSQMQLAIFLANPEAFDGNINTLRVGSMLNVPSAADVASLDAAEAKQEVARQRQAYRPPATASRPVAPQPRPEPKAPVAAVEAPPSVPATELALVEPAPIEPASKPPITETPPVAQGDEPAAAPMVEPAETTSERIEESDQAQLREPTTKPATTPPMTALERLRAQQSAEQVPVQQEQPQTDVTQVTEDAAPEPEREASSSAEPDVEPEVRSPAPVEAPGEDGGSFPWLVVLLALIAGGGIGYLIWKRRQPAAEPVPTWPSDSETPAPAADKTIEAPAPPKELATGEEAAALTATASLDANEGAAELARDLDPAADEFGLDATTVFDAGDIEPADAGASEETAPTEATQQFHSETIMIDVSGDDPVAEADFHLAYGLYDEAALLLQQAMDADPGRADIKSKLAEVYFAASQPEEFVDFAKRVQSDLTEGAPAEWQRIAIMGQQLVPDEPMFQAADDAGLGAGVDLDFDSAPDEPATDFDLDAFEDPTESSSETPAETQAEESAPAEADSDEAMSLEFDLEPFGDSADSTVEDEAPESSSASDDEQSLEFDLDLPEPAPSLEAAEDPPGAMPEAPDSQAVADSPVAEENADSLAFDIDDMTSDAVSDELAEADALLDGLDDFDIAEPGDTGDSPEPPVDAAVAAPTVEPAPLADDLIADTDLADMATDADDPEDFDFGDFGVTAGDSSVSEVSDETAGGEVLDNATTEVPVEPAPQASTDFSEDDQAASEAFLDDLDDFSSEPSAAIEATGESGERESEPTPELSMDLSDFDFDSGSDEAQGSALDAAPSDDDDGFDLSDFDLGEPAPEAAEPQAAAPGDDFDLDAAFDVDTASDGDVSGDVGSKLDLARAYVDMGDAEMAGSLLDDVLASGTDEQKAEASGLKAQLTGGA